MNRLGRCLVASAYRRLRPWLEAIEEQHEAAYDGQLTSGVLPFHPFLLRLIAEIDRAERYGRDLGLVVFQLSGSISHRKKREAQAALRDSLRRADIPGCLSETLLGVILPETGAGVNPAMERLAGLLSRSVDGPVGTGFARFPEDGVKASDLLRVATHRSGAPTSRPGHASVSH